MLYSYIYGYIDTNPQRVAERMTSCVRATLTLGVYDTRVTSHKTKNSAWRRGTGRM